MSTIQQRIDAAIKRITDGHGCMRIPADETDPDLVLADCKAEIASLRAEVEALRVDAERYRRVRAIAISDGADGDRLDSGIDAAVGADA